MTTTPGQPRTLQPNQMAIAPEEMFGVILCLRPTQAMDFLEWVIEARFDVEERMKLEAEMQQGYEPEEPVEPIDVVVLNGYLESLGMCATACISGAALAEIYKPLSGDEYHFIALESKVAVTIVEMLAPAQNIPVLDELYREVVMQVDKAFVETNEFINVPEQ